MQVADVSAATVRLLCQYKQKAKRMLDIRRTHGILRHEFQIHLPPGETHPRWTHGKGAWCAAHWLSLEPRMRGLPHPRSKTMTYEEKLTAQEILALPDRELLQPLTVIAPLQATAVANVNAVAADNAGDASGQQANPVNAAQGSQQTDAVVVNVEDDYPY